MAGALAATLTFSGAAAVHACLLVWRGPNPYIENDSWVLYSILNLACLITVPLLNWSGTLRRLGAKAASIRDPKGQHTQGDISTRTIVIYWAFLVLVGFICIWEQTRYGDNDTNMEYPDMSKVICRAGTNASMFLSPNGTFHRRAVDSPFVQDNGCTNPCDQINIPSIFRQQSDLVLLSHSQALLWNFTLPGIKYQAAEQLLTVENKLFNLDYYTLPFVVLQGLITALFGRRDPREIRDLIYINLYMERPLSSKPGLRVTQDILARVIAAFNYVIAVAVVIFCPVLFIISLVSSEMQFWSDTPDSEAPYAIGQWEPWAVVVQVLLAALIARYHDKMIGFVFTGCQSCWARLRNRTRKGWNQDDKEHGHALMNTVEKQSMGNKSTQPIKSSYIDSDAPTVTSTTTPAQDSQSQKPLPSGHDRKSLNLRVRAVIWSVYKCLAHPLNQNDKGLLDEARNFFRWCRDPCSVSRLVVRHPIRPRDARNHVAPLNGPKDAGNRGNGSQGEKDGKDNDRLAEMDMAETDGNKERSVAEHQHEEGAYRDRLDSGFFKGGRLEDPGRVA